MGIPAQEQWSAHGGTLWSHMRGNSQRTQEFHADALTTLNMCGMKAGHGFHAMHVLQEKKEKKKEKKKKKRRKKEKREKKEKKKRKRLVHFHENVCIGEVERRPGPCKVEQRTGPEVEPRPDRNEVEGRPGPNKVGTMRVRARGRERARSSDGWDLRRSSSGRHRARSRGGRAPPLDLARFPATSPTPCDSGRWGRAAAGTA